MKLPFMPLFLGDLLADTLHLSAQEFGAYMLLILHAWKNEGHVPYDRAARIARIRHNHWPKVFKELEPFFEWERDVPTGTLQRGTHKRVRVELHNAAQISSKRKGAAEQMHAKRRANASHPHTHTQKEEGEGKKNPQEVFSSLPPERPPLELAVRGSGEETKKIRKKKPNGAGGELASALPTGALARPPSVTASPELAKAVRAKGWVKGDDR